MASNKTTSVAVDYSQLPELEADDIELHAPAMPTIGSAAAIARAKATIAAELGIRVSAIAINVRL